jgi:hypothetical protein
LLSGFALFSSLNHQHFGGVGIATLGTPEAAPGCDCATDAIGSIAMRKGIMNFIVSLDSVWLGFWVVVDGALSKDSLIDRLLD